MRGEVVTERRANLPALFLLAEIIYECENEINQPARDQRISEIDEQVVLDEEIERQADEARDQTAAEHDDDAGGQPRRGNDDRKPKQYGERELGADCIVRIYQTRLAEHAFQNLGV